VFLLTLLAIPLGYALYRAGGVVQGDWYALAAVFGAASAAILVSFRKHKPAPPLPGLLRIAIVLLPAYLAFQLIPLPLALVSILSPARASVHRALSILGPVSSFVPLSLVPHATLLHLIQAAACVVLFLGVRECVWRLGENAWMAALPLLFLAVAEAAFGLWQSVARDPGQVPSGTYVNHNHFAGLLEMALPFAILLPVALWRGRKNGIGRFLASCAAITAAAVMLAAILRSLSRMGLLAALTGLGVCGVGMAISSGLLGRAAVPKQIGVLSAAAAALIGIAFVWLPPEQMVQRFGISDIRAEIWKESVPLVREYWLVGCGSGAYESAFMKWKQTDPMFRIDYAHNDYLQRLIELGIVGCTVAGCLIFGVLREIIRAAGSRQAQPVRALAIACLAGWAAILLHSLVDFNLYIPANALVFAWIGGIAVSLQFAPRPPQWRQLEVQPSMAGSASLRGRF